MKVVIYTTHCPQCRVLEKKLTMANIEFEAIDNIETIRATGITQTPALQIDDGELMNFKEAVKWVREVSNG